MTPPVVVASPRCATIPRAVVLGALLARATGARSLPWRLRPRSQGPVQGRPRVEQQLRGIGLRAPQLSRSVLLTLLKYLFDGASDHSGGFLPGARRAQRSA